MVMLSPRVGISFCKLKMSLGHFHPLTLYDAHLIVMWFRSAETVIEDKKFIVQPNMIKVKRYQKTEHGED